MWDLKRRKQTRAFGEHAHAVTVTGLTFSQDDRHIVSHDPSPSPLALTAHPADDDVVSFMPPARDVCRHTIPTMMRASLSGASNGPISQ